MKIVGVLIAYNPKINALIKNIDSYINDLESLIIVNNSDYSLEEKINKDYNGKIKIINFYENLGIAKAQNVGMEKAFLNGADFVIQMDQDSIFNENGILELLKSYHNLKKNGFNIGILGPSVENYNNYNKEKSNINVKKSKKIIEVENKMYKRVKEIISSGTIISKEVYEKVGGVREELFIDYVDTEYCWRIRKNGFEIYQDLNTSIFHNLGNGKIKYKNKEYIVSAPIRNYYQTRNELFLLKYAYVPLNWKRDSIKRIMRRFFLYHKIMPDSELRKKYIRKGIKDFFLNKMGRIDREF